MSGDNRRNRHKKVGGKSFIILPIIFFLGIYSICYFTLVPYFGPMVSAAGIFFSDTEKDYSTEYNNIFVPVEENSTVPVVTKDDGKEYVEKDSFVFPNYGDRFGQLIFEDCGIDCSLFFGDGNIALRNGAGMYNGSFIPGYGGTTLVAGHNNTYFNGLKYAKQGQEVVIKTSYGNYKYKVTSTEVKKYTDSTAYDLSVRDKSRLIMYTCYPFDELGLTENRFFVYADLVEGTMIDPDIRKEGN